MLDVAVGLIFVYLVLSLLSSAIAEYVEHYFKYRADYLRQGIEKLLLNGDAALRAQLYEHPLITSLYTPSRLEGKGRSPGPAYIPARQFVLALLDVAAPGAAPPAPGPGGPGAGPARSSVADISAAIAANPALSAPVARALQTLLRDAGEDIEAFKKNVERWFDAAMDRVAGWYKRRAQVVLLVIGLATAVIVNADTLWIVDTLSNDSVVRAAVTDAAEAYIDARRTADGGQNAGSGGDPLRTAPADIREQVQAVSSQLGSLGLPVGWRYRHPTTDAPGYSSWPHERQQQYLVTTRVWPGASWEAWRRQLASHLLGWLLTAVAISFGAPFWFDTLNKIMVIRSTVKPREKSREEGSEDRR